MYKSGKLLGKEPIREESIKYENGEVASQVTKQLAKTEKLK